MCFMCLMCLMSLMSLTFSCCVSCGFFPLHLKCLHFPLSNYLPPPLCLTCSICVSDLFFLKKYFTPCFWRVPCVSEFFPKISDPVLMCLTCLMCFVCLVCFFVFHVFFFLLYFFCSPKNLHPVFDVFDVFQIRPRVFHECILFHMFSFFAVCHPRNFPTGARTLWY